MEEDLNKLFNETEDALTKDSEIIMPQVILMNKFSPVPYAEELLKHYNFLYDKYKRFWRYDNFDGVWKEDADDFIKNRLRTHLLGQEQQKKQYADEVVSYLRDLHYNPNFEPKLEEYLIPFNNCIYDIRTGEILKFNQKYFVTGKIPVKLKEGISECKIIDSFMTDVVGETYKEILYDLCAYCLYRGYPYQKFFLLFGAGKNGKSTFLEMLMTFLGRENVSGVSPHDLLTNRFALGDMWNKLANISSDISYNTLTNVNKIKGITGGDTVHIERKFKNGFPTKIYAKQIFSTNQPPIVNDKTDAFFRRVYLIGFPKNIKNPDKNILNKITIDKELSGLAWNCCLRLKRMYKNNFDFIYSIDEDKIAEVYEDLSNPLHKFLREHCNETDPNAFVFKYEFRDRFGDWCKENKLRIWSETELGIEMKKRFETQKKQQEFSDKYYNAWVGIKFKDFKGSAGFNPFSNSSLYIDSINRDIESKITLEKEPKNALKRTFEALETIEFMILKDKRPVNFKLIAGKTYETLEFGDEQDLILEILLKSKKIKICQKKE